MNALSRDEHLISRLPGDDECVPRPPLCQEGRGERAVLCGMEKTQPDQAAKSAMGL